MFPSVCSNEQSDLKQNLYVEKYLEVNKAKH